MYLRTSHSASGSVDRDKLAGPGDNLSQNDVKGKAASAFARRPLAYTSFGALSRIKVASDKLIQRKKKEWTGKQTWSDESEKCSNFSVPNCDESQSNVDYFDEDYDFDSDEDDQFEVSSPALRGFKSDDVSTVTYMTACKSLDVVPTMFIARNLTSDEIIMKHHPLGPTGFKACAIALVKNASVKRLDIAGAEIGEQGAQYVADMLRENIFITDLMLGENHIGSGGLEALAEVLETHSSIRKLDLSGNGFEEKDAIHFVNILEGNTQLKELILRHNSFREKGGITLSTAIANNDTLEHLDISWNHLRWKGAQAICNGLADNNGLKSLNLAWNGFYIHGCKAMATALRLNDTLLHLDLSCNRIDRMCLKELLDGVKANHTLQTLRLCFNPITTDGAMDILNTLEPQNAQNLNEINISSQCVREEFVNRLEELKKQRPSLKVQHGMILHNYLDTTEDDIKHIIGDPMIILMECMRIRNLRLVDLFTSLDKDGSGTLTREEFSKGLEAVNVPLNTEAIGELIDRLDTDGDGEVDFAELVYGQRQHKQKMSRIMRKNKNVPPEENAILKLSKTLKEMMNERFDAWEKKKKFSRAVRKASLLHIGKEAAKKVGWAEKPLETPETGEEIDQNANSKLSSIVDDDDDDDDEDNGDVERVKNYKILLRKTSSGNPVD